MSGLFVTGTDTNCGKTQVSLGLMAALQARGWNLLGMKPVATGCAPSPAGLRNHDALQLLAQGSAPAPYRRVNPYAFAPPIAPHIAAAEAGVEIELGTIETAYRALEAQADRVVVEGAGGWRVPLGSGRFLSDIPKTLDLDVVLVIGLKLGCLNHARLTLEAIRSDGCRLAGWIANQLDPEMASRDANLATLHTLLDAPCLGVVPRLDPPVPDDLAGYIDPGPIEPPALP